MTYHVFHQLISMCMHICTIHMFGVIYRVLKLCISTAVPIHEEQKRLDIVCIEICATRHTTNVVSMSSVTCCVLQTTCCDRKQTAVICSMLNMKCHMSCMHTYTANYLNVYLYQMVYVICCMLWSMCCVVCTTYCYVQEYIR